MNNDRPALLRFKTLRPLVLGAVVNGYEMFAAIRDSIDTGIIYTDREIDRTLQYLRRNGLIMWTIRPPRWLPTVKGEQLHKEHLAGGKP